MKHFKHEETVSLLNSIGENIFITNTDFDIVWINDYANELIEKLSEYILVESKEDLIGKNMSVFHKNNGESQRRILTEGSFPYESKIILFDRYTASIVINPFIIRDQIEGYVLTWKDVTVYEKGLTDINDALDQSTILTYVNDKGEITYVNDKFCELSKYKKEDLIGKHFKYLHVEGYSDSFYQEINETIEKGESWRGELCQKAKDGSVYWVDKTIVPFMSGRKPYQFVAIQQDITYKKEAEVMLRRSEKLSVLGELAAGVAHEIRNPLTSIKGFTQISTLPESNKQIMLDEIERINLIVNEFMMLAKPDQVKYQSNDVIAILQYVVNLLHSESNLKNVHFQMSNEEKQIFINCEENQMKQVFLNIFKNGIEAMPEGGVIRISVSIKEERVYITIADQGVGLSSEEIKRLGEPFYSLKKNGTGLGLMMTFKIIENHDGSYKIESEEGKGTILTLSFLKQ
ncbi:PAS domain-containing sensor histidine kinase [Salipaludibacillus neizhouensis]|uniref:histidine kinase n=1 Tax=Salipaludibacillus neizhouensis TaxID=885475 RepID=A0A3A9KBM3_9BACI|nr:PAS domain-containing sensor histidine kinase [Salipaludibacillus neizhouensis]RKL67881.1 PAS domain-containing sensor histidine kinase [Salipaludibacillus neizhouensis]